MVNGLKKLHKIAFGDSDEYIDYFFANRYNPDNSFVHIENDEIVGACHSRGLCFSFFGKQILIPFLTGVATLPEYRHKGIASSLVNKAVKYFTDLDYPFVCLHPFNAEFYQKLNFEGINYTKNTAIHHQPNQNISYRQIDFDDLRLVESLYFNSVKSKNAYVKRCSDDFKQMLRISKQDNDLALLIYQNNLPAGYLFAENNKILEYIGENDFLTAIDKLEGYIFKKPDVQGDIYNMARVCSLIALLGLIPFERDIDTVLDIEGQAYNFLVKNKTLSALSKTTKGSEFSITNRQLILLAFGNKERLLGIPNRLKDIFPSFITDFYERY